MLSATEQFAISLPGTVTAGETFPITLTAEVYGTTTPDTSYTGKVHVTSTDPNAVLPMDFTFAAGNKGVVTLTGAFETTNAGQTITVVDVANPANIGTSNPVSLINPNSDTITVSVPATSIAGDAVPIVVTAFNGGTPDPNYVGTVKFSSTDPTAILPGAIPSSRTTRALTPSPGRSSRPARRPSRRPTPVRHRSPRRQAAIPSRLPIIS